MPLDFTKGSITLDFAKTVAGGVETYERYHTEDLAALGTYIPGDEGLFSASFETTDLVVQLKDGGAVNRYAITSVEGNDSVIGDGVNLSFYNASGVVAGNLTVMRHSITTGTYERYNTQDLGIGASYIPADEGLFSHASEGLAQNVCEYQYDVGVWWLWNVYSSIGGSGYTLLGIGDGTNLRYRNTGAAARWLVVMRAIMVT